MDVDDRVWAAHIAHPRLHHRAAGQAVDAAGDGSGSPGFRSEARARTRLDAASTLSERSPNQVPQRTRCSPRVLLMNGKGLSNSQARLGPLSSSGLAPLELLAYRIELFAFRNSVRVIFGVGRVDAEHRDRGRAFRRRDDEE